MTTSGRSDALTILVSALATYRLTRLVVEDKITEDLREKIWAKYSPEETRFGYLLTCAHCTSVWVGLAVVLAQKLSPGYATIAADAFALAGAVSLVNDARAVMDVIE